MYNRKSSLSPCDGPTVHRNVISVRWLTHAKRQRRHKAQPLAKTTSISGSEAYKKNK